MGDTAASERIVTVGPTLRGAEEIAERLRDAGFRVAAAENVSAALASTPAALVTDPVGWHAAEKFSLRQIDTSRRPPPVIILATDGQEALYEAMTAHALLPSSWTAEKIRDELLRALSLRRIFAESWPEPLNWDGEEFTRIVHLIEAHAGYVVRPDRWESLREAVRARVIGTLSPTLADYQKSLAGVNGKREFSLLLSRVVVGETYFWRYSGQMQALEALLVRRARLAPSRPVRIWCAGCSTGEETYSLAMAAAEALGEGGPFTVWGTDINPLSVRAAEEGIYGSRSLRNLPAHLLHLWMEPSDDGYRIREGLRNHTRFLVQNLASEECARWVAEQAPFDAIFCRNVVIYFSARTAQRFNAMARRSLAPGGGLFLGSAEALMPPPPDLEAVHESGAFYYRKLCDEAEPDDAEPAKPGFQPTEVPSDRWEEPLFRHGMAALDREDFDGALGAFQDILDRDPASPLGNTGLAVILANQGREVEAREKVSIALQAGSERAETFHVAGLLAERAGEDDEALRLYDRAIACDPNFFMSHFNRAWIFKRAGRTESFRLEMRRALAILRAAPKGVSWATGGLSFDAILELVADAVEGGEGEP